MREIEFRKLEVGDVVFNPGYENEPWTVVAPSKRHDTFLLLYGRHNLTPTDERLWLIMAMIPDKLCLEIADYRGVRVGRIFDPQKWSKESKAA